MCKRSRGDGRNIKKKRGNRSLRAKLAMSRKRMSGVKEEEKMLNILRICKEAIE